MAARPAVQLTRRHSRTGSCVLLGIPPQDSSLFRDRVDVLFDLSASTPRERRDAGSSWPGI
jgi:hypothetical protein